MTTSAQILNYRQPGLADYLRTTALRELFQTGKTTITDGELAPDTSFALGKSITKHVAKIAAEATHDYQTARAQLATAIAGFPANTDRRPQWTPRALAQFNARYASRTIDHSTPEGIEELADVALALQEAADLDPFETIGLFTLTDTVRNDLVVTLHARAIAQTSGDTIPEAGTL
ncbi:hypothetical protein EDF35_1912 [Rathayibacter sp. PhB151]|uniref:hypothetical protein n=1 Tax=Rathayibacter sp. PhB151 TaxID=2485189 RepID=UPI001062FB6A|nr:hypothetical protein [Rathayibacter sp. PhB151]TDX78698.1 hypothetical protein EDF35_1912 [Rathayibacter sp. PhB151]